MTLNQRDVVEVNFKFPKDIFKPHPVIVLSVSSVTDCEGTFVGVPISHSAEWHRDEFSFPLHKKDFNNPLLYNDLWNYFYRTLLSRF
jgi:hypothetical protein